MGDDMSILGAYDPELNMYCEPEHGLDLNILEFYRWLKRAGKLTEDLPTNLRDDSPENSASNSG